MIEVDGCGMIKVALGIVGFMIVMAITSIGLREDGGKSIYESKYGSWIPILSNHQIVKVRDLPNTPILRREDGKHVDLGYYYHRLWGGEWVGYIGSPNHYVPITDETLKALVHVGIIDSMPAEPERPLMFDRVIIYAMTLILLGGMLYQKFFGGRRTGGPLRTKPPRSNQGESEVDWDSVDERIRSEANAIRGSGDRGKSPFGHNANAGFGRRKV